MSWIILPGIIILVGLLVYLAGPRQTFPQLVFQYPHLPEDLKELEQYVVLKEAQEPFLRPNNEARIIWCKSYETTPYSLVYLHGFSASHGDAADLPRDFSERYGCNLFLSRLAGHGVSITNPFLNLTPQQLIDSAMEAVAIGKKIGRKVILMGTSTGCTLALAVAAREPAIAGLICYSPNINLKNRMTRLLSGPWGLQLARRVYGGPFRNTAGAERVDHIWTERYRLEALVALQVLIRQTMKPAVFKQIHQPLFLGYYFKNEREQDLTVSVAHMLSMYDCLGTPLDQKRKVSFPNAGAHNLLFPLYSGEVEAVRAETFRFTEEILGLTPILS